jgi:ribosomal protein L23
MAKLSMAKKTITKATGLIEPISMENKKEDSFDPYKVLLSPLSTEKSIRHVEFNNTLVFSVALGMNKFDVRRAVEELFKVRVKKVKMHNSFNGGKRAFVKLAQGSSAADVSADLGLI